MDTLLERLTAIKSIFNQHDIEWVEPFETTLGAINNKEVDTKFRGLYYFYENNFYVGIASRGTFFVEYQPYAITATEASKMTSRSRMQKSSIFLIIEPPPSAVR